MGQMQRADTYSRSTASRNDQTHEPLEIDVPGSQNHSLRVPEVPMTSLTVKLKDHPAMRGMLKTLGYRRTTARIVFTDRVELNGRYWDSGSRTDYTVVDIVPMRFTRIPPCNPPQFGGPQHEVFHDILPGQCVISHGTFCGKPAHACVYINKADGLLWLGVETALTFESENTLLPMHGRAF
jgi:hypothetical protein